jgi:hypothetical protein
MGRLIRGVTPLFLAVLGASASAFAGEAPKEGAMGVKVVEAGKTVRVEIDGQLFTEYHPQDADRPFFFPVIGPTGENVTRNWPVIKDVEGEERDHPHHRGLWYAHGAVNGLDFWTEGKGPKILHQKFTKLESGADTGVIESEDLWVDKAGQSVCSDVRRHVFYRRAGERMLDFEITLIASHGKLVLGDTKEGSMALRVASTMRAKGPAVPGHILNSEGVRDGETWGKRAAWCAYYGPVKDQTVCLVMLDHPSNPRYPTWWHVRDYGLFAANPFGQHQFEGKGSGDLTVNEGERITFRYRFVFLKGEADAAKIGELQKAFAETKRP